MRFAPQTTLPPASPCLVCSRKDGHTRGRSRWFVHNAGYFSKDGREV